MFDPRERLTKCVSDQELERRWALAREVMLEDKVDYLLMRNDEEFLGGYVRWFSDLPARHSYPFTLIFPYDDEMTLITCGPFPPADPSPPLWAVRGVKQRLCTPYFPTAHYTHTYDAELALKVLREKKDAVIGLVGRSFIPVNFYEYLKRELPNAGFADMTDRIDHVKAIKSGGELDLIRATASLQDEALKEVRQRIRPGVMPRELLKANNEFLERKGYKTELRLFGHGQGRSGG